MKEQKRSFLVRKISVAALAQRPLLEATHKVGCFQCSSCHACR